MDIRLNKQWQSPFVLRNVAKHRSLEGDLFRIVCALNDHNSGISAQKIAQTRTVAFLTITPHDGNWADSFYGFFSSSLNPG